MCGLAGMISWNNACRSGDAALQAIAHRGPDAQGSKHLTCAGAHVWLGHTRLSILDLSEAGAQPMASPDGRWWIVFNGEVYNHNDLRAGIDGPWRGHSDTESIVVSLQHRGIEETLRRLNGMYAFAALDTKEERLYLARDPFGIKPLYHHLDGQGLRFASEMGALRELGVAPRLDSAALQTFLTLRYTPSPETLLQGVHRLAPGHLLTHDLRSKQHSIRPFVRPQTGTFSGTLTDATQAYEAALRAAVERQLLSDVPVGLLLSGGIDSALIAAMAKEVGTELMGFTVGFGDQHDACEISDAAHTAAVLGLPHRAVTVDPQQLWNDLPQIVRAVEEPLGTTSILPMWSLVATARQDVTVVLTGQGSDEPWGGYRRYQQELIRSMAPDRLWRALRHIPRPSSLPEPLHRGLRSIPVSSTAQRFLQTYTLFDADERRQLTGTDSSGAALERIAHWLAWQDQGHGITQQQLRIDTRMNLSDDLLLYGDKISMAVALEARVPMLDVALMQFVESLPLSMKVNLRQTKIVHKAMAERYLPSAIVHRKKKGFQVPFGDWCRGVWRERVEAALLTPGAPHLDYLNPDGIRAIWDSHQHRNRQRELFALLVFALWCTNTLSPSRAVS